MTSDRQIIGRIRRGDREALGTLYDRHSPALRAYLVRRTGTAEAAEEILQDVFLALLEERGPRTDESVAGWLFTVARNRSINHLRRRQTRLRLVPRLPAPPEAGPDEDAAQRQRLDSVARALATLPEEQREALLLKQAAGLTVPEIAALQGVPAGTVKSRLHTALHTVRAAVVPTGEQPWTAHTAKA